MDVALASCMTLPEPDPDEQPTLAALRAAGLSAATLAWDDPLSDFASARMTLLRATWNYSTEAERFAAWAEHTAVVSRLWNPWPIVRWNLHKSYLLDLERAGVPIVPTCLVRRGETTPLEQLLVARGWSEVVIKPAVSAASRDTVRIDGGSVVRGEAHLRALAAREDVLVQPYFPSVGTSGERALVWIDGELTHAVRKTARFSGQDESVSGSLPISAAEAEVARRALAAVPGDPMYARIDVAPAADGRPHVMELELIEPSLFFPQNPTALDNLVRAVRRRLE
jgi:hypothetical protein